MHVVRVLSMLLSCSSVLVAQEIPAAVISDPPRDAKNPATTVVAAIASGDATMNGLLYVAAGAGPHPTLLLLHGLPGNEQNLDLAQAVRRAGWNVLTMHYRGSWGSGGAFSFTHAVEDVHAALAWLRAPANATTGRIDVERLAVAGHSFGGMLAAEAGGTDPKLLGVAMISAWNLGGFAARLRANGESGRAAFVQAMTENRESLAGCTPQSLADDAFGADAFGAGAFGAGALGAGAKWDFLDHAAGLAPRPLLLVSSSDGNGPQSDELAKRVRAAGGKSVTELMLPTDHSFSDHRIALAAALVRWLAALPPTAR